MSPATLRSRCNAARVPCHHTAAACYFMGCKGEQPCVFSASHEFCETPLLFHCCLFRSPGFWHKPLREIVGSGTNLKPYNLLYLKVPLYSETNSLSVDSVYEPLLLFSLGILSGSGKYTPWGHIPPALQRAGRVRLGSFGTVGMRIAYRSLCQSNLLLLYPYGQRARTSPKPLRIVICRPKPTVMLCLIWHYNLGLTQNFNSFNTSHFLPNFLSSAQFMTYSRCDIDVEWTNESSVYISIRRILWQEATAVETLWNKPIVYHLFFKNIPY